MTLSEIRARLEELEKEQPGETIQAYSQRLHDQLPRIPFKELPLSLQREARKRFTPERMREFLELCYNPGEFETAVADIPADALEKILIRCRNIATYTIEDDYEYLSEDPDEKLEKMLIPYLYGGHAVEAFETAVHEYRARQEEKKKREEEKKQGEMQSGEQQTPKNKQPTEAAERARNIVSAGYYQVNISDPDYQHALSTQPNKNAYIVRADPKFFESFDFSAEDGTFTVNPKDLKDYIKDSYSDIKDIDFPLLSQIYTAAWKSRTQYNSDVVTVSIPEFCREMGISPTHGNGQDIMAKLRSFESCLGIMPGRGIFSELFHIIEIDIKEQTMKFAAPYISRLFEALEGKNYIEQTTRKGEERNYLNPFHNELIHSTIVNERNKPAIELVVLITNILLRRGYEPDSKLHRKKGAKTQYPDRITRRIEFRYLIDNAPLLRGRIESYKSTQDKNKALRRAFAGAYQLLETETDAADWFVNLKYRKVIPTMATLNQELIFTHDGRNGDYIPKDKVSPP